MNQPKYINSLEGIPFLSQKEKAELEVVSKKFQIRVNEYYLNLIDWEDENDPLRRIVIPHLDELEEWGRLDASDENKYTVLPGVQHKYDSTVLFLVNSQCAGYCRFCFRKRLFLEKEKEEVLKDLEEGIRYLRAHPEASNLLLTGGDALLLPTPKLEQIISRAREVEHIRIIRLGSKVPAYNPYRILNDTSLLELIRRYSKPNRRIYVMTHFNHPNELTGQSREAISLLIKAGAMLCNQTPLIRGVNDNPFVLSRLFKELSFLGVAPYYVFQCRPTIGNKAYAVPIEEGYEIFEQARMNCSGLAKRARFVMSHSSGKIEIVGKSDGEVYFKYHRSAQPEDSGKFMGFKSNPEAYWFDDYEEVIREYPLRNPFRVSGPE